MSGSFRERASDPWDLSEGRVVLKLALTTAARMSGVLASLPK